MKIFQLKIFPYGKYIIMTKKSEDYDFAHAIKCTRKLTCV